ncbi:capsular polysaccharide synthesis protein [Methylomonas sp. YC3]
MNNIWMYWENQQPEYIRLCIQSVKEKKGNLTLHLLDQNTVQQYLPDLRPEWFKLRKAAHKADYIRTRLVYQYGGIWLDCDMVALDAIEPLIDFPENYDYACQDVGSSIGCFVGRPGCKVLEKIIQEQDRIIDEKNIYFEWNDIGNNLLKKHGKDYPYYRWDEWVLDEIYGGKNIKLISRHEEIADNVSHNAVVFHLCNEDSGILFKKYLRDSRLLTSNMLVSKIFRKSFGIVEAPSRSPDLIEFFRDYNFKQQLNIRNIMRKSKSLLGKVF